MCIDICIENIYAFNCKCIYIRIDKNRSSVYAGVFMCIDMCI